jgi:hypothetical protein
MPQTKPLTGLSLALAFVRASVKSIRAEGIYEPIEELERAQRDPSCLYRKSPVLLEALDVVLEELRRDSIKASAMQPSDNSVSLLPQAAKEQRVQGQRATAAFSQDQPPKAVQKAAKRNRLSQQPLPGLSAAKNGRGRNCNAQNAKHKPLSGSSASLKKRL